MRDRRRLHNMFSRAVSLLLGLLLCLEPLSVVALAVISEDVPAVMTEYKPTVVVEGNAVVTGVEEGETPTAEDLTGFFEVALKVQTTYYVDNTTTPGTRVSYEAYVEDQAKLAAAEEAGTSYDPKVEKKDDIGFGLVNATLQYDASIFTPVSWSATEDIFDSTGALRAGLTTADGLTDLSGMDSLGYANLDAIGPEEIIDGVALAYESGTAGQNILFMSAQVIHETVHYDQPTTVVVVRFAYNKNVCPMLTTDGDSKNYVLGAAGAERTTAANGMTDGWNGGGVNADAPEQPVLWLADDPQAANGPGEQSVWYDGNYYEAGTLTARETAYYYYIGAETDPASDTEPVTYVDANGDTQTRTIPNPNTEGKKVLSLDYKATPAPDPSYLDNVLKQNGDYPSLVFQFVNAASFLTSGVNVDDVAPILFYDWDNTLLGVLVVEKGKDVRAEVNAFVSQWIHEEIIDAIPTPDVSSLARFDNYRGKYNFNGPAVDPGNADTDPVTDDGEEYPLTNKLDYVFFKRPMEPVLGPDTDGDNEPDPIPNQWQQMSADDGTGTGTVTAEWDEDYPYVYGWASCVDKDGNPDPTMVEATWTTLGMGELSSYSGASSGGYNDIGTTPATFTYDSDDVKFTFADFKTGVEGPTYVKAVYEPGENLLTTAFFYRMVDKPYYNKLNASAASAGGAYSVDVTYERSYAYTDGVRGVARIREPVVRQNTTADVKWEEEGLTSATIGETYTTRAKVTYTKIDVENTEQIPFTLVLSGRQNRVDYYIADNYKSNFVSGGDRSSTNNGYRGSDPTAFVIDNYNYLTDESAGDDDYYDASYENRDGSHGFVLYGTLNNLMEEATKKAVDSTYTGISSYVSATTLADANIRMADGTAPSTMGEISAMIDTLTAAAAAAKAAYNDGNDAYWNAEKDCAQLTYHQLQGFIIHNHLNHGESPVAGLTWCHLHADCAALFSDKPDTWDELIQAVKAGDAGDQLSFVEMDTLAGLRRDSDGTRYPDSATLLADLNAAVTELTRMAPSADITWDRVQGYILKRDVGSPEDAEQVSYDTAWWYEGGEIPTDLASVLAAALYANPTDPTVPVRNAKLNTLKDAFNQVTDPDAPDNTKWNDLTDNLMAGETTTTNEAGDTVPVTEFFSDFDTFVTKLKAAVRAVGTSNSESNWREIQYYLIHGNHSGGVTGADEEKDGYWWYKNGKPIVDTQSMLEAAAANSAMWQSFTVDDLYSMNALSFSANFAGAKWSDPDFDFANFKTLIEQIAQGQDGTTQTWHQVQYRIIHRTGDTTPSGDVGTSAAETEGRYYWWADGNDTPPTMAHSADNVQNSIAVLAEADTLVEMAFRIKYNGIPDPRDANTSTSTNHGLTDAVLDAYRLQKTKPADTDADYTVNLFKATDSTDPANPTNSADVTTLLNLLDTLLENAAAAGNGSQYSPPDLNWFQIQYALLNGGAYLDNSDNSITWSDYDGKTLYWWRMEDANPNAVTETRFDKFLGYLYQLGKAASEGTSYDLTSAQKPDYNNEGFAAFLKHEDMQIKQSSTTWYTNAFNWRATVSAMKTFAQTIYEGADGEYSAVVDKDREIFKLTWYQVQYAMLKETKGQYVDAKTAEDAGFTWAPAWVTASSASVMSLRSTVPEDQYTSETTVSEDGLTTTVVENLGTWNDELGDYDWTITTTVTQQVGELTVTTITVTTMTYDPETWQPIFDTTTETRVADAEAGDATYDLAEDTDLTPVQPSDGEDDQTPEESDPAEDDTQTSTGGDQTYQPGADAQTTPVETAGDTAADDSDAAESDSETGAVSAASAGLLSLAWRTNGTGPGISLALARPVSSLRVTGILDTGQLFGSQRDGPLGILPSRSTLPTVAALLANRRIRT